MIEWFCIKKYPPPQDADLLCHIVDNHECGGYAIKDYVVYGFFKNGKFTVFGDATLTEEKYIHFKHWAFPPAPPGIALWSFLGGPLENRYLEVASP